MRAIAISTAARVRLRVWPVSGIEVVSPWVLVEQDQAERSQPRAVVRVRVEAADTEVSDKEAGAGVGGEARRPPPREQGPGGGGRREARGPPGAGGGGGGGPREERKTGPPPRGGPRRSGRRPWSTPSA